MRIIFVISLVFSISNLVNAASKRNLAAVAQLDSIWDKGQVSVCFGYNQVEKTALNYFTDGRKANLKREALSKWSNDLKSKIKNWVNSEYNETSTVINFIGWNDCNENAVESDAIIFLSTEEDKKIPLMYREYGRSSIGRNSQYKNLEDKLSFVWLLNPKLVKSDFLAKKYIENYEHEFKLVVIHEFGHLAGLLHEHERKEIENDLLCRKIFSNDIFKGLIQNSLKSNYVMLESFDEYDGSPIMPGIILSEYDPNSIMNYCFLERNKFSNEDISKLGLSKNDRTALKYLYRNINHNTKNALPSQ